MLVLLSGQFVLLVESGEREQAVKWRDRSEIDK
jgi:hypothetical protein